MTEEQRDTGLEDEELENSQQDDSSQGGNSSNSVPLDDYKNLQAKFTTTSQEAAALKERLVALEAERNEAGSRAESDALEFLDSEEVQEEIDADPSSIVKYLKQAVKMSNQQLESELVAALKDRDQYYHGRFLAQNPEYQEVKDEIEQLRRDEPAFANLSDEAMMAVVKRTSDKKGSGKSRTQFRGNPGGTRAPVPTKSDKDVRSSDLYKKIYGE